jgi:3-hydroxyisobutyrate dehydrogenase-like beta-hydroxyacid dehydrogenase
MTRIGFIGTGTMGRPMAANLVKSGFAVTLFDSAPGHSSRVAGELGCSAAESLEGLADCGFVITMLPDGKVVQEVLTRAGDRALAVPSLLRFSAAAKHDRSMAGSI